MQTLKISFNSVDEETGLTQRIVQSFDCSVDGDSISYKDTNETTHNITIGTDELKIYSLGEFDVRNHYIEGSETKLNLTHVEKEQSFDLNIRTNKLIITKNEDEIFIDLEYKIYEGDEFISEHEITIEVC